jgi:hypothetical protein
MGDLDTDYAARLNHAYQTLRGDAAAVEDDLEADAETEECQPSAVASDELRRFFSAAASLDSGQAPRAKRGQWRRLTRRSLLVAALGLIVGVAVFILVSLMSPANPHLQMSPNRSAQETATEREPSYLQGTTLKTPDVKPALLQPLDAEVLSPSASPWSPHRNAPRLWDGWGRRVIAWQPWNLRQGEIAEEMARMVAEREELARQQVEQARQRQEEAQRLDARRRAVLAEAERQERQVAEAEARLQAEREALEQQRGKLSRQESGGGSAWEAEQGAALVEAERKLLLAAEAEARLKAEREVLERQKAEQDRREQELAKQQEAERQVALAEAQRRQREAAEAETRLKAERQALERLKAEQAQREKTEAKSREAERQAELAEAKRQQRQAAEAEARAQAEQKALERQAAEQARVAAEADRRREAESKPAPSVADPNNVVARLTHVYGQGDLEGLVSLFTADAQVSGGRGKAFIRGDYAAFFAQHPYRQLQIKGMKWQAGKDGRLVGTGSLVVKTRQNSGEAWWNATGTIRFELLPVAGGYKISGMEHEIN